jgi:hypothetical protein
MKYFAALLSLCLFITGCEDLFVKTIDVDSAGLSAKLVVTATLDTDSGRLTLSIGEGRPLQDYNKAVNNPLIRNGTVRLFENDREIFTKSGVFNMSPANSGYHERFTNISAIAGCTYRIEIDMEAYDKATATAVMPETPFISGAMMDTEHYTVKKNVMEIRSLGNFYSKSIMENYCFPFSLIIDDRNDQPDYYSLRMEYSEKREQWLVYDFDNYRIENEELVNPVNIATPNLTLIQDNPDVESNEMSFSEDGGGELYSFDLLVLTDATFRNRSAKLDLYALYFPVYNETHYYPKPVVVYRPYLHGNREHFIRKRDLLVTHLTQETFRQYRNMAFQLAGIGFFTEPVFITSNMENAYGCFSLQNTVRINVESFEGYSYSGTVTDDDFTEIPEK